MQIEFRGARTLTRVGVLQAILRFNLTLQFIVLRKIKAQSPFYTIPEHSSLFRNS